MAPLKGNGRKKKGAKQSSSAGSPVLDKPLRLKDLYQSVDKVGGKEQHDEESSGDKAIFSWERVPPAPPSPPGPPTPPAVEQSPPRRPSSRRMSTTPPLFEPPSAPPSTPPSVYQSVPPSAPPSSPPSTLPSVHQSVPPSAPPPAPPPLHGKFGCRKRGGRKRRLKKRY
ncbi:uncharacterized protein LOC128331343 [Hemicordylus capensis]|uniref:uncharacterized protein LOC128331343 n=1 Tax=Hemicordylus capensis TaxID=884348 RepID=UPI00230430CB|nr:uncharacterized protein LOC128331343 [Hemicordylus capensis]